MWRSFLQFLFFKEVNYSKNWYRTWSSCLWSMLWWDQPKVCKQHYSVWLDFWFNSWFITITAQFNFICVFYNNSQLFFYYFSTLSLYLWIILVYFKCFLWQWSSSIQQQGWWKWVACRVSEFSSGKRITGTKNKQQLKKK